MTNRLLLIVVMAFACSALNGQEIDPEATALFEPKPKLCSFMSSGELRQNTPVMVNYGVIAVSTFKNDTRSKLSTVTRTERTLMDKPALSTNNTYPS